ncbi:MAG: hypothetical protein NZ750_11065 [Anaerolineae bacterium]|nr:hypothetical protein [Anaerolineae bacterium]MDW8171604.1 hypothetical protein [Anaerolineae bacterium]
MPGQILILCTVLLACWLVWRPRTWPIRLQLHLLDYRIGLLVVVLLYWLALVSLRLRTEPLVYDDTLRYWAAAQHVDLLSANFWLGDSPPLISVYFSLFGRNAEQAGLFVTANLLLHSLTWLSFVLVLVRSYAGSWWRVGLAALLLAFSLTIEVVMWTGTMLAETLSLSIMLLWLAAWLRLLAKLHTKQSWNSSAALLMLVSILFALVRDVHIYLIVGLAGLFGLLGLWRGRHQLA